MSVLTAILGYHKVGPENEEGRWLNVSPRDLRAQIRFLSRRGFEILPASALHNARTGRQAFLTFDDAYLSFFSYGVEVLKSESVPATTYVVPGRVGESSTWDGDRSRPLMSWEQLEVSQAAGVEIGNHTMTHPRLADLSAEGQLDEIGSAHNELLARGFSPKTFCLPYGSYSSETLVALDQAGYKVNLTVKKGLVPSAVNPLELPRVMVSFSDRVPGLWYKLFVKPVLKGQYRRT